MRLTSTADRHDLLAAERFLAAEGRIAGTFGRIEEAVAPWTQATDASGALKATRDMPEPDSLGG